MSSFLLKRPNVTDPDPAFHFDGHPDPDPTFDSHVDPVTDASFQFDANPDLDHTTQFFSRFGPSPMPQNDPLRILYK